MLVPMKEILEKAREQKYGVIAPNVINEDTARACIEAAVELDAPLILDFGFVFHKDIVYLGRIIEYLANQVSVPIALNLDHGATFEQAVWAIRAGFTSVMVDRSTAPLEQNIRETKEIVKMAHAVNVSVEAELGHVGEGKMYGDSVKGLYTDVEEAQSFVTKTGIDCLAVAVGTAHGQYNGLPHLNFELLNELNQKLLIPLVLHGGSGTGDANLVKAIKCGITKINIATDLFTAAIDEGNQLGESYMIYHRLQKGFKDRLIYYMKLAGQAGKASN
ncbi:class II fructose-bisphosphate aldolase [Enterococcus sp. BWT-B8]|uniref:class II fructose-bisphosphate aldolase n=1 Tax=unclassified Enterococcus TaxID=2608891 RepID=UPI001E5B0800|nr:MULTISPECIES: class II fructose-bisphosphate aldolase [unclassified Enterococcus]MCB5951965.1 class II fructose-bisphosphate aldolase [Enterococcus sp. BWT-B8]MCB5954162.1 class II fructose-bisphosphate aldolase [Enterococcus sp. CWB-B31]